MREQIREPAMYPRMLAGLLFWCAPLLVAYEFVPEALCLANEGALLHFAGKVGCNTIVENLSVAILVSLLIATYAHVSRHVIDVKPWKRNAKSNVLSALMFVSMGVTTLAVLVLWQKTAFSLVPDPSARPTLVVMYHDTLGAPLVAPFLYLAIATSAFVMLTTKRRMPYVFTLSIVSFGCYVTMSRGFILSALLPAMIALRPVQSLKLVPLVLAVFFLRDILNGNLLSYADADADPVLIMVNALGEFTNTYFGRRYILENALSPSESTFLAECLLKGSGLYYLALPFFKLLSSAGISIPSATQNANDVIEQSLGITGFAGSAISDFVFHPVSSIVLAVVVVMGINRLYCAKLNLRERIWFTIIAATLLPNAFRWSMVVFLCSTLGMLIAYITLRRAVFVAFDIRAGYPSKQPLR